ncbi:MAG: hypothetical protein ABSB19_00965 [Methylomonas sp.]
MKILIWAIGGLIILLISACNKEAPPLPATKETPVSSDKIVNLQGTVSNDKGLIKAGKIEAKSIAGVTLAETRLDNSAQYQLEIPAGAQWPLLLHFSPVKTEDGVEKMVSAAIQPATRKYDINPNTTAIAKQAKLLGGYTLTNLARAAEERVHVPDANKTTAGFRGDPTTQYGGWH